MRVTKESSRLVIFFCGKCVYKKSSSRVISSFCGNACDGLTRPTAKKNYTTRRFFCYMHLLQKKIYTNYNIHEMQHRHSSKTTLNSTLRSQVPNLSEACWPARFSLSTISDDSNKAHITTSRAHTHTALPVLLGNIRDTMCKFLSMLFNARLQLIDQFFLPLLFTA